MQNRTAHLRRQHYQMDETRGHSPEAYTACCGQSYLARILKRYRIHRGGRALETFRPLVTTKTVRQILDETPGGCATELADTRHIHIDLFGNDTP